MGRDRSFTLIELLIVIVIIGILVIIAFPLYNGIMATSKMSEVRLTVDSIVKAEDLFYLEHGFMAALGDEVAGYDLPKDNGAAFEQVLNITIPTTAKGSYFTYEVYDYWATIYVRNSDNFRVTRNWEFEDIAFATFGPPPSRVILCKIYLESSYKGTWVINTENPYYKYFKPPENANVIYSSIEEPY